MRLIDADKLPRHGRRGGIVYWRDIEAQYEERKGKYDIEKALKLLSHQMVWMYDDGKISYEMCLDLSSKLMDIAKMVRGEEDAH